MEESSKMSFSFLKKQLASDGEKMNLDNLPDFLTPKKVFVAILLKHVNQAVEKSKDKLKKLNQATAEKVCNTVFENARRWDHAVEPIVVEDLTKWIDIFEPIKQLKNLRKLAINILKEYNAAFTQKYKGYVFPCDGFILTAKIYLDIFKKRNPGQPINISRAGTRYLVLALMLYGKSQDLPITNYVRCGLDIEEYTDSFTHKPVKIFKKLLKEREELFAITIKQNEADDKPIVVQTFAELKNKLSDHTKNLNEDEWKIVKKYAEDGEVSAQTFLGINYYGGERGLPQDFKQAFHWLTKAAKQKQARAQYYLGRCYLEGQGIKKDPKQAIDWLKKAAEQKDSHAQLTLGMYFASGEDVPKELKKAAYWYEQAAEQKNSFAQLTLGVCYAKGEGVPQDSRKAAHWYQQAANQGDKLAQFSLGMCYYEGNGVTKDIKQAFSLLEKAGNAGEPHSQFMISTFYKKGEIGTKDDKQAIIWLEKAAKNEYDEAQFTLGVYYWTGEGVDKDFAQAISWLEKAAAKGHARAKEYLSEIVAAVQQYTAEVKKTQFGATSPAMYRQPAVSPPVYHTEGKENKEEEDDSPHP